MKNDLEKEQIKQNLLEIMKDNHKHFTYGREDDFSDKCIEFIEKNKITSFDNELQKNFCRTMFNHMDTVTVFHCIETASLANELIENYEKYENREFEKDFKINKDDFIKGMIIHDCGKVAVEAEALITSKNFRDLEPEERDDKIKKIKKHTDFYQHNLENINEEANPRIDLNEVFSEKITNIAKYHHPDNFKDDLSKTQFNALYQNAPYLMVATQIDVFESMRTDFRPYKGSASEKKALEGVESNINKLPDKIDKHLFENLNNLLELSRFEAIHEKLRRTFKFELVCAERATYNVDNLFEKVGLNVQITTYNRADFKQYEEENKIVRDFLLENS